MEKFFKKGMAALLSVLFILTLLVQSGLGLPVASADSDMDYITKDDGTGTVSLVATSYARVYTAQGLKTALATGSIEYIEFGADINVNDLNSLAAINRTLPIANGAAKGRGSVLVINGAGRTLTGYNGDSYTYLMMLETATVATSSLEKIHFKNMTVNDNNGYGMFYPYSNTTLKEVEYENVTYTGRQLIYLPANATYVVFNNSTINITSAAQELVENGTAVYFVGDVSLNKSTNLSMFTLIENFVVGARPVSPGSSTLDSSASASTKVTANITAGSTYYFSTSTAPITVKEGASFELVSVATGVSSASLSSLTLENGAKFSINNTATVAGPVNVGANANFSANSLSVTGTSGALTIGNNANFTVHRASGSAEPAVSVAGAVTVGEGATLDVSTSNATGVANGTMRVGGDLTVNSSATFRVVAANRTGTYVALSTGGNITINNPKELFIYNNGTAQAVNFTANRTVTLTLGNISYWKDRPTTTSSTPNLLAQPDYNWSASSGTFTVRATTTSTTAMGTPSLTAGSINGLYRNGNTMSSITLASDAAYFNWSGKYVISTNESFDKVPYSVTYQIYDPVEDTHTAIDFSALGNITNPMTGAAMGNYSVSLADMQANPALTAHHGGVAPVATPDLSAYGYELVPIIDNNYFRVTDKTAQQFTVLYYDVSSTLDPVTGDKDATRVDDNLWRIDISFSGSSDEKETAINTDIMLTIDVSGSMNESVNGVQKLRAVKDATKRMLDSLAANDNLTGVTRVGVVIWDSAATKVADLTPIKFGSYVNQTNIEQLKASIEGINYAGGTYSYRGINMASSLLYTGDTVTDSYNKYMILLSDGADGDQANGRTAATNYKNKGGKLITIGFATSQTYLQQIQNAGYYTASTNDIDAVFDQIVASIETTASIARGKLVDPMGEGFVLAAPDGVSPFNYTQHVSVVAKNGTTDVSSDANIKLSYATASPPTRPTEVLTLELDRIVSEVTLTYYVKLKDPGASYNTNQATNGETIFDYTDSNGNDHTLTYTVPTVDNATMVLNLSYSGPAGMTLPGSAKYTEAYYPDQVTYLQFSGPAAVTKGEVTKVTYNGKTYASFAAFMAGEGVTLVSGNTYQIKAAKGTFALGYEYGWVQDSAYIYDYKVDADGNYVSGSTPNVDWFASTQYTGAYSTEGSVKLENNPAGLKRYNDKSGAYDDGYGNTVYPNNYIFDSERTLAWYNANANSSATYYLGVTAAPEVTVRLFYGVTPEVRIFYALDADDDGTIDSKQMKIGLAYYMTDAQNVTSAAAVATAQYPFGGLNGGTQGQAGTLELNSAQFATYLYNAQNYVLDVDKTKDAAGNNYNAASNTIGFNYGVSGTIKLYYALDIVDGTGKTGADGIPDYKQRFTVYNEYKADATATLAFAFKVGQTTPGMLYNANHTYVVTPAEAAKHQLKAETREGHKPYVDAAEPGTPAYFNNYIFDPVLTASSVPNGSYSFDKDNSTFTYAAGKDDEIKIVYSLDENDDDIPDHTQGIVDVDHAFYKPVDNAAPGTAPVEVTDQFVDSSDHYYGTLASRANFQVKGNQYKDTDSVLTDDQTDPRYEYRFYNNYIYDPVQTRAINGASGYAVSENVDTSGLITVTGETNGLSYTRAASGFVVCFSLDANDNGIPDNRDSMVMLTAVKLNIDQEPTTGDTLFSANMTVGTQENIVGIAGTPAAGQRAFDLNKYKDLSNPIEDDFGNTIYPNNYIYDADYNATAHASASAYGYTPGTYPTTPGTYPTFSVTYGTTSEVLVYYAADFDNNGQPDYEQDKVYMRDYKVDANGAVATTASWEDYVFGAVGNTYTYNIDFNKYKSTTPNNNYIFDYARTETERDKVVSVADYQFDITVSGTYGDTKVTYTSAKFNVTYGTTPDIDLYWALDADDNGIPDYNQSSALVTFRKLDGSGTDVTGTTPPSEALVGVTGSTVNYNINADKYADRKTGAYEDTNSGEWVYPNNYIFDAVATVEAQGSSAFNSAYSVSTTSTPPYLRLTFGAAGLTMPVFYALDANGDGLPDRLGEGVVVTEYKSNNGQTVSAVTNTDRSFTGRSGVTYTLTSTSTTPAKQYINLTKYEDRVTDKKVDPVTNREIYPNNYIFDVAKTNAQNTAGVTFSYDLVGTTQQCSSATLTFTLGTTPDVKLIYSLDANGNYLPDDQEKTVNVEFIRTQENTTDKVAKGSYGGEAGTTETWSWPTAADDLLPVDKYTDKTQTGTDGYGRPIYGNNYVFDAAATAAALGSTYSFSYNAGADGKLTDATLGFTYGTTTETVKLYYAADFDGDGKPDSERGTIAVYTWKVDANGNATKTQANPVDILSGDRGTTAPQYDIEAAKYAKYVYDQAKTEAAKPSGSTISYSYNGEKITTVQYNGLTYTADGTVVNVYYAIDEDENDIPDYLQSTAAIYDRKVDIAGVQQNQAMSGTIAGVRGKDGVLTVDANKYNDLSTTAVNPVSGATIYPNNYCLDISGQYGTMASNAGRLRNIGWNSQNASQYQFGLTFANAAITSDIIVVYALDIDNNGQPDYDQFSRKPVPNQIWEGQRVLTGTGQPGATIYALLPTKWWGGDPEHQLANEPEEERALTRGPGGSKVGVTHSVVVGRQWLLSTEVDADGYWNLTVPSDQALVHSQKVTFYQVEENKDPSEDVIIKVYRDFELNSPDTGDGSNLLGLYFVIATAALATAFYALKKKRAGKAQA